jgi:sugar phosphate isomerase/epimerase
MRETDRPKRPQLSLSVRVAESFHNKRVMDIPFPTLARMAAAAGYGAICLRASVVGIHSTPETVAAVRRIVDELGLAVSMVTGDFAVPENGSDGPACLRHITPYLDLADALGSDLIRVCLKQADDIVHAQRAADEAQKRGIRLAHQSHTQSLFETVAGSLDVLHRIGRPNFGLIYEPANLALCGQDYGLATLKAFAPYLFNVYLQNHAPDPNGALLMQTWTRGAVPSTVRPLDAAGGIDFEAVFAGLQAIGYGGSVTVHQAFKGDQPPLAAAQRSARYLAEVMARHYP